MSMTEAEFEATAFAFEDMPCRDEDCDGTCEQEKDGDYLFWTCQECGFAFGYIKISTPQVESSCSIGVPVSLQQAAQVAEGSGSGVRQGGVPVSITRK